MTHDLFAPSPAPTTTPAPDRRPTDVAPPAFGSRAWTLCPCGAFASLHFPNAGGLRRCHPCAVAEGRMKGPDE